MTDGRQTIKKGANKAGAGCLTAFGAIFFFAGVGIFLWGLVSIYDAYEARGWQPVEATITHVEQVISRGDDSTTYGVNGSFQYQYQGQSYTSSQLNFYTGTDNIGSYQQDFYYKLSRVKDNQKTITAYVNPDNPNEAVIDKSIRWGMLGFQSIFLIVFGGVGLGIMLFGRFAKKKAVKEQELQQLFPDEPWNWKDEWQTNRFKANTGTGFKVLLGFAIFWNLIAIPASVMAMIEFFKTFDYPILFVLLFPLVGIGLMIGAYVAFMRHKKYGQSELILQQTPIAIGGINRGTIEVPNDRTNDQTFGKPLEAVITLTCQRKTTTGSGKNRSTKTSIIWQDDRRVRSTIKGHNTSSYAFEFKVPEGLPQSDESNQNNRVEWVLEIERKQPGIDLKLQFMVPGYVVAHRVALEAAETDLFAADFNNSNEESSGGQSHLGSWKNLGLEDSVTSQGNRYYFSAFRNLSFAISMIVFGLIFASIGIGVNVYGDAPIIFLIAFGGFGILFLMLGLRQLTYKSEVTVRGGQLQVASGHLLMSAPKIIQRSEIESITANSNMSVGNKQVFHVSAKLTDGSKVVLAKNLLMRSDVESFIEKIKNEIGIRES
ncbi:DUF3592 domain-containing protein [Kangiella koreensis]|uniref:DUF3592 domain-containing protein n=1 Tax=Kangiella koreensis (strain DSM 16069 / JCM 12317 / KCTC 12182 / SW-125) TaxID=523791 RepID=C7R9E0_KANKD|nr:DUF3592 domain-containing protein [Kangiella koreensis]ACV26031.1 hypothetical protein Kkor_0611 [Kangiella koreensis DSM 16069]